MVIGPAQTVYAIDQRVYLSIYLGEAHREAGLDVLARGEGGVEEGDAVGEHGHLQAELLLVYVRGWGRVCVGCVCVCGGGG